MSSRPRSAWRSVVLAAGAAMALAVVPSSALAVGETLNVWQTGGSGSSGLTPQTDVRLGSPARGTYNVEVDDSKVTQTVDGGFGASFTDSSAYLLMRLKASNPSGYSTLMNKIFGTAAADGIGLRFWRVPMTSSDFTAARSHWTSRDSSGSPFALSAQDTGRIIPVIRDALAINPNLRIMASPWSAPGWMKSNGSMICNTGSGNSTLLPAHYQDWADYFVSWIRAYESNGIPIWGVSAQNEPGYCPNNYPGMTWTPAAEGAWVANYLRPSLTRAGLSKQILGFDHNWEFFANPLALMNGSAASFDGLAWHCYDNPSDPAAMTKLRNLFPTKSVYETECSSDTTPTDIIRYGTADMTLKSVQNWAQGVITWNLALDQTGGPQLGGCVGCVGLITIDSATSAVTLRNNYFQLGQISKFVAPGARHIASTVDAHGIVTAAFKNPDGQEVLVAHNTNATSTSFTVSWNGRGSFNYTLPSRGTVTFRGTVPAATSLPATPAAGRTFKFVSRTSGKPFGVSGASTANGARVVQWLDNSDWDQQWRLVDAGGGYWNLINRNSGLGLDNGGTSTDGVQMQQWAVVGTGNFNQQWQITAASSGYYRIVNRTSGKSLDVRDGSLAEDAAIQQWTTYSGEPNQEFQLVPTS
ncbi:RICIN domain-containing protein [Conexibacter woesei]|uniref:RICIN domain-containing protein n=1 Tax=Conexibacter woesei TaxID=191495 RepID=UPI00135F1AAC|nr:RICIN domain-containing protein [Conexibacter woesei]